MPSPYSVEADLGLAGVVAATSAVLSGKLAPSPCEASLLTHPQLGSNLRYYNAVIATAGEFREGDCLLEAKELIAAHGFPVAEKIVYDGSRPAAVLSCFLADQLGTPLQNPASAEAIPDKIQLVAVARVRPESVHLVADHAMRLAVTFRDFAYGFVGEPGLTVVDRTTATAVLSKALRVYGGSGFSKGVRLGRVLRKLTLGPLTVGQVERTKSDYEAAVAKFLGDVATGPVDCLQGGADAFEAAVARFFDGETTAVDERLIAGAGPSGFAAQVAAFFSV